MYWRPRIGVVFQLEGPGTIVSPKGRFGSTCTASV